MKILTELHYLPGIEYFANLINAEKIIIEACENFQKQTFRNRCQILGANKIENLIIPVKHTQAKILIRDVEIDWSQRWHQVHLGAISSAYGKSPFFDFYISDIFGIYNLKSRFLFDFNLELLTLCLKFLKIKIAIEITTSYIKDEIKGQYDLRGTINPKEKMSSNPDYTPSSYIQNFGKQFVPGLSIVDLLFCEGNYANDVLKQSMHP